MDRFVSASNPEEQARFCAPAGLPSLSPELVGRQRPDALWMLRDEGGAVTARCSLWWNQTPPCAEHRLGLIGHYAVRDGQAAAALLRLACDQLASHGCTLAVGPMDGNTWQNYRLVVERGPEPPFFLEPDNPDDWPDHFVANGFAVLAHYYSALNTDLTRPDPALPEVARCVEALGVRVRPLCFDNLAGELSGIHALSTECFRDGFLFTPIGREEFLAQYLELRPHVRPELVLVAEQEGRIAGYIFAVPDLLQARRGQAVDTFIIKTLAVHPELHGAGLGRLLAARCHEAAAMLGYRRAIHALMQDTSGARRISDHIARPMRRYALFARPLDTP